MNKLTDDELAELVATEVMGWEKTIQGDNELAYTTNGNLADSKTFLRESWNPRNDWNDAGILVKQMNKKGLIFRVENGKEQPFAAEFFNPFAGSPADDGSLTFVRAEAETVPEAITLAALKACNSL